VSFDPSPARRGLDLLLATYPHLDLIELEWQADGPWLLVTLGQESDDEPKVFARHPYAILRSTGAVHGIQHDGAVTDDPILAPEPVPDEDAKEADDTLTRADLLGLEQESTSGSEHD
jgi:hypothetical protein